MTDPGPDHPSSDELERIKRAEPEHDIHDLLEQRWSPRAFSDRPLGDPVLLKLFEAARWAPSSNNEQPWRFLMVRREDAPAFAEALSCLKRGNRTWAAGAPVIAFTFAKRTFTHKGGENRLRLHDVGQAVAHVTFQATALGVYVHQMGGILLDEVRRTYGVPDAFEPVTAIALGYLGDPGELPDDLRAKELRRRKRRELAELVFAGRFGRAAPFTVPDR